MMADEDPKQHRLEDARRSRPRDVEPETSIFKAATITTTLQKTKAKDPSVSAAHRSAVSNQQSSVSNQQSTTSSQQRAASSSRQATCSGQHRDQLAYRQRRKHDDRMKHIAATVYLQQAATAFQPETNQQRRQNPATLLQISISNLNTQTSQHHRQHIEHFNIPPPSPCELHRKRHQDQRHLRRRRRQPQQ